MTQSPMLSRRSITPRPPYSYHSYLSYCRCAQLPLVRVQRSGGWLHRTYAFYDGPTAPLPLAVSLLPSNGATSRFLGNFDVLSLVFDAIYQDPDARRNRKQLLGFMLTTKVFFHHAAAVLWRALDDIGLEPLLNMLNMINIQGDVSVPLPFYQPSTRLTHRFKDCGTGFHHHHVERHLEQPPLLRLPHTEHQNQRRRA